MSETHDGEPKLEAALGMEDKISESKQARIVEMLQLLRDGQENKVWAVAKINRLMQMETEAGHKVNDGLWDSVVMMEESTFNEKAQSLVAQGAEVTMIGRGASRRMIRFWTEDGVEVVQEVIIIKPQGELYEVDLGDDKLTLSGQISSATAKFQEGVSLPVFVPGDLQDEYRRALQSRDLNKLSILEKVISEDDRQLVENEVGYTMDELIYGSADSGQKGVYKPFDPDADPTVTHDELELGEVEEITIAYTYEDIQGIIAHAEAILYEQFQAVEEQPISGAEAYLSLMNAGKLYRIEDEASATLGRDISSSEKGRAILGILPQIGRVRDLQEMNLVIEKLVFDAMTFTRTQGNFRGFKLDVCNPVLEKTTEKVDANRNKAQAGI